MFNFLGHTLHLWIPGDILIFNLNFLFMTVWLWRMAYLWFSFLYYWASGQCLWCITFDTLLINSLLHIITCFKGRCNWGFVNHFQLRHSKYRFHILLFFEDFLGVLSNLFIHCFEFLGWRVVRHLNPATINHTVGLKLKGIQIISIERVRNYIFAFWELIDGTGCLVTLFWWILF